MTLPAIFITSFIVAFSGAMMPGPLLTVTISETPRRGILTGPMLIAGHGVLELTLVIALLLGLVPLLRLDQVFIFTAIVGSGVLLWMALGMFKALPAMSLRTQPEQSDRSNPVVAGALLSIVNPYWTIWWVTIGLGYIMQSLEAGTWGVVLFFGGHILADLVWYSLISYGIWKGKAFMSDRIYRCLIGVCAAFLVVFAVLFARAGVLKIIA